MRTQVTYKFETESDAKAFVDNVKANKAPVDSVYIHGPSLIDEDTVFKNMSWASKGLKYWVVNVESYF